MDAMPLPQVCSMLILAYSGCYANSLVYLRPDSSNTHSWSKIRSVHRRADITVADCVVAQDEAASVAEEEALRRMQDAHSMQTVGDNLFRDCKWESASKSFTEAIGYSEGSRGTSRPCITLALSAPPFDRHRPIAQRFHPSNSVHSSISPKSSLDYAKYKITSRRNRLCPVSVGHPWTLHFCKTVEWSDRVLQTKIQGPELSALGAL